MKHRDLVNKLKEAGYRKIRDGDHEIFKKPGGRMVEVPKHREVNENTAKQILKDAGLI
ncbi:MAG: type II toxin-antitoxin system HicA family toxin [Lachnospiraceae bacterium]|jgi:mRNA interferase HicA